MSLDFKTCTDLVIAYFECGCSPVAALHHYSRVNNFKHFICSENTVTSIVNRFVETGSVHDKPRSGRPRVSEEKIEEVKDAVSTIQGESSLGIASTAQVSNRIEMPKSTVKKVLKEYLNWHPYRLQLLQQLKDTDFQKRLNFSSCFLNKLQHHPRFLSSILWSDESHFTLEGNVFTHQAIVWAPSNPQSFIQKPNFPERITVWCGFSSKFILPPYFFSGTVTSQSYKDMLVEFVIPELEKRKGVSRLVFQQDGAPPHIAGIVMETLRSKLDDNYLIGRNCVQSWPPRSPDLSPADYYLWGALKGRVYKRHPTSIEQLKAYISEEIANIQVSELAAAVNNLPRRLEAVVEEKGGHFEHYF